MTIKSRLWALTGRCQAKEIALKPGKGTVAEPAKVATKLEKVGTKPGKVTVDL